MNLIPKLFYISLHYVSSLVVLAHKLDAEGCPILIVFTQPCEVASLHLIYKLLSVIEVELFLRFIKIHHKLGRMNKVVSITHTTSGEHLSPKCR